MADTETTKYEGISAANLGYETASALQIRLDCTKLLAQIEYFLRGLEPNEYFDEKSQSWATRLIPMGSPKANKTGIQSLLYSCRAIINPQVVQGNYTYEQYIDAIISIRIELARNCFVNFYNWELKNDNDIAEIPDFIMNMVEPFLSRTIDNKERDSYAQTFRTTESNTLPKQGGGIMNIFGGGNRQQ